MGGGGDALCEDMEARVYRHHGETAAGKARIW
jgi:hypothetical protein